MLVQLTINSAHLLFIVNCTRTLMITTTNNIDAKILNSDWLSTAMFILNSVQKKSNSMQKVVNSVQITLVAMETNGVVYEIFAPEKMASDANEERFPNLNEEAVQKSKENSENSNTKKSTQNWINVWMKWATERKINAAMESYQPKDLDVLLQK